MEAGSGGGGVVKGNDRVCCSKYAAQVPSVIYENCRLGNVGQPSFNNVNVSWQYWMPCARAAGIFAGRFLIIFQRIHTQFPGQ